MSRLRSAWWDVVAVVLLAAVTLLLLSAILFTNRVLAGVDALTYFTPYRDYADAVLRRGQLPLWNPYLFLGVPFLANMQAAVLYPLNWLLAGLWAPKSLAWSAALHIWLAAAFTYGYARFRLSLGRVSAWMAGAVFGFSGFLGGQVEHINQLSSGAWLPLVLWLYDAGTRPRRSTDGSGRDSIRWASILGLCVVVALQLLAGHMQSVYITAVGLAIVALWPVLEDFVAVRRASPSRAAFRTVGRDAMLRVTALAVPMLLGAGLAAVQLLPTLELSALSVRAGGLPYREAAAFSLRPRMLLYTLLPVYGEDLGQAFGSEGFTEYIAYTGVVGLGCAMVASWKGRRDSMHRRHVVLALAGLVLAMGAYNPLYYVLYRVMPGFDLFRVPARWMLLFTFGVAVLAGLGTERLSAAARRQRRQPELSLRRRPLLPIAVLAAAALMMLIWLRRPGWLSWLLWASTALLAGGLLGLSFRSSRLGRAFPPVLALLAVGELLLAGQSLPHASPTAPEAVSSLRTAPAELLSDTGLHRFISLSDITYDPGDLSELSDLFAGRLTSESVYDLVVASKQQEILAPNLPLLHRIQAVDGYDGGILPLARYVALQRLFLDEADISPDGRLREQLKAVPAGRLLSLLNVKYVITDKLLDLWADDVYYDLQFQVVFDSRGASELVLMDLPPCDITAIGMVSHLEGAATLGDGQSVGELTLYDAEGRSEAFVLRAGSDTSEGKYAAGMAHREARVVLRSSDDPPVQEYLSRRELTASMTPRRLAVRAAPGGAKLVLRGVSLIDERTGAHWALTVSSNGRFARVHSGDVKVYENLDVLPRAYVVHNAVVASTDDQALRILSDSRFDPAQEVVLQDLPQGAVVSPPAEAISQGETVRVLSYEPERVSVEARLEQPGFVVLADTHYPGWKARLDGDPVDILRANLHFRAVYVAAGEHSLEFHYEPASLWRGAKLSAAAAIVWLAALLVTALRGLGRSAGRVGPGAV